MGHQQKQQQPPQQQQPAGHDRHGGAAMDVFAWFLNVSSSVSIVFVNKVLMSSKGYGFGFAVTLSALHFLMAAACVRAAQALGITAPADKPLPVKDTVIFAAVSVASISALNLSLFVNPVGLYQVAKLLVIPYVCAVEAGWFGRRFDAATLLAIATVAVGVGAVTVTDFGSGRTSPLGVAIAAASVAGSGTQQILCGALQRAHGMGSAQLLAATAPLQGLMLLLLGPPTDWAVSGQWVWSYVATLPALGAVGLSCLIAVAVNVSQFMCLGRFTAVTFQVLGHTKTLLVLLISWAALGEAMPGRKLAAMAVALAGMVAYGVLASRGPKAAAATVDVAAAKGAAPAAAGGGAAADSAERGEAGWRGGGGSGGGGGGGGGDQGPGLALAPSSASSASASSAGGGDDGECERSPLLRRSR